MTIATLITILKMVENSSEMQIMTNSKHGTEVKSYKYPENVYFCSHATYFHTAWNFTHEAERTPAKNAT